MAGEADVPEVTDLRLVAVTPERSHLVLEDSDSKQFRVPVDERLAAALRTPDRSRPGQLEIALESQLTPREIQARVRAGQSVDEVAAVAGISLDRVERYAGPVLAERAHVVEQAQAAPARRATAGTAPALAELVDARLAEQKVATDSVTWDAWRGDDDRWTVRLSYLGGGRQRVASWVFDPRGRVLAASDDEARWLVDGTGAERLSDDRPAAVRRLAAVPHTGDAVDGVDTARRDHLRLPRRRGLRPGGRRGAAGGRARGAARADAAGGLGQPRPSPAGAVVGRHHVRPAQARLTTVRPRPSPPGAAGRSTQSDHDPA